MRTKCLFESLKARDKLGDLHIDIKLDQGRKIPGRLFIWATKFCVAAQIFSIIVVLLGPYAQTFV